MSESTTESTASDSTATTDAPAQETTNTETDTTDWQAEAKKWEARSKANFAAAKEKTDLEKRLAAFEDANKSEADKLADRATKAEERASAVETRWKSGEIRRAITDAAINAKTIDAETVYLHAQAAGGVEIDDDGNVTGADKVVANLLKAKPHLFASPAAGARDTHASSAPPALNSDALTGSLMAALNIPQQ